MAINNETTIKHVGMHEQMLALKNGCVCPKCSRIRAAIRRTKKPVR